MVQSPTSDIVNSTQKTMFVHIDTKFQTKLNIFSLCLSYVISSRVNWI